MKKNLLFSLLFIFSAFCLTAQTTVLDFETDATSGTFQYFGSTIDGEQNMAIANPDASGINTSSMVAQFDKPMNSEVWAGAFSIENAITPIDLTSDNQVCIKVWSAQTGNLALKLENGTADNWIFTQEITEASTWVNICYDANAPSIEAPSLPAAGGVYNTMVLFFDFGSAFDEDRTYYFDDVITQQTAVVPVDITFNVDMNEYAGTFTTAYVSGTMNGWAGDANPMEDPDGDGVWTTTITGITSGAHEYKFTTDNWADQEMFNGNETCTITDESGDFTNRRLTAISNEELETVCFNSCYACGEAVNITFELGTSGITVSPEGVFIAGGGNFGNPGENPLTDPDGDGIYSATFERPIGFESFYTFTNGACGDFSCKEDIAGQDCADPDNFNDRFFGALTEDLTIATCFGECTTDATSCAVATVNNITFQSDLSPFAETFTTAYVSGSFNGWSGDANPMTDDDGDGIWETTIQLPTGPHQYKIQVDEWAFQEEFAEAGDCNIQDGDFINRAIEVSGDATACFVWNTCDACFVNTNDLTTDNSIFTAAPTLVQNSTVVTFGDNFSDEKELTVINMLGQRVAMTNLETGIRSYTLTLDNLENGLYFINVTTEGKQQTQRIVVNR